MSRQKKKYANGQPRFTVFSMSKHGPKRYAEPSKERAESVKQSIEALTKMYGSPVTR